MDYEHIEAAMKDGLGVITLNRPPLNVLNMAMMEEISQALRSWQGSRDLKILLFKARGKCFSAGVDVGEHIGDNAPAMIEIFHRMFRLMDDMSVMTMASVYGSCLGGGCELAIFCDLVIASDTAKFGQPEIQVGVFPPIAAFIMPRIIGRSAALDLILSGRIISAQEAIQMGLVNKVVREEDLEKETDEIIKPYLKLSAQALRLAKKAVMKGLRDELSPSLKIIEEVYLNELMKTHDAHEGLQAFMEKRPPHWKNE